MSKFSTCQANVSIFSSNFDKKNPCQPHKICYSVGMANQLDHFLTKQQPEDFAPDAHLEDTPEQPYDGGGWPGDGSGTDDFEDYNQREAEDYYDE